MPIIDDGLWFAQRRGVIGMDRSRARWELLPVFVNGSGGQVRSLRMRVSESGPALSRDYSLGVFQEPAQELLRELMKDGKLGLEDEIVTQVLAFRPQPAARSPIAAAGPRAAASPAVTPVVEERPLPVLPGRLEEWQGRAAAVNPQSGQEGDTPVFILRSVFERARASCRRPGELEGGAFLTGRLYRQAEPVPEIFLAVEGSFEASHALQERFSLTFTAGTYGAFEEQLERRRRRLNRPEEILAGVAHGHGFLPGLGEDRQPLCPACPKRAECGLHSAFYSSDDLAYHRALFSRLPFALGLVFGLDPREHDVVRAYGYRDGSIQERSFWLVSD
ncbi:MAG: hypothetical protein HY717_13055 [Planctomycetes bacterium]|nr:hypothetical protein [Planctomycetota bacterium]